MAKKKPVDPVAVAPVEPVVVAPVVEPEPGAEVVAEPVIDPDEHPQVRRLGDGRWVERRFERERTVMIHGVRYEHVSEDADGRWIYARG